MKWELAASYDMKSRRDGSLPSAYSLSEATIQVMIRSVDEAQLSAYLGDASRRK